MIALHIIGLIYLPFPSFQCDPSEATWQLIDSIVLRQNESNPQRKIGFLGGGCSLATEPVAALSGRFYNIPHVGVVSGFRFRAEPVAALWEVTMGGCGQWV
jgi:hypothetical protein